jgi:hypothetical protein
MAIDAAPDDIPRRFPLDREADVAAAPAPADAWDFREPPQLGHSASGSMTPGYVGETPAERVVERSAEAELFRDVTFLVLEAAGARANLVAVGLDPGRRLCDGKCRGGGWYGAAPPAESRAEAGDCIVTAAFGPGAVVRDVTRQADGPTEGDRRFKNLVHPRST